MSKLWAPRQDSQVRQAKMLLREAGKMGVRVTKAHDRETMAIVMTGVPFTDAAKKRMSVVAASEHPDLKIQVVVAYEAGQSNDAVLACLEKLIGELREAGF